MAGKSCKFISEAKTQKLVGTSNDSTTLGEVSQHQMLPPEIIIEILLWLPPESLTQLRCVCKSWNTLISDPNFIKMHLHKSIEGNKILNHRIYLRNSEFLLLRSCPVDSILEDQTGQDFYIPLNREIRVCGFIGSCNGLACLAIRDISAFDDIFIFNPCTRKSQKFPYKFSSLGVRNMYGFGYDSSTDDYKLVRIDNLLPLRGKVEVDVYTLSTCSGRRIQDFPSGNPVDDIPQVFVNGALHWRSGRHPNMTIIALDLGSETYIEIPQPKTKDGGLEVRLLSCKLGVLLGSLVLICQYGRSHYEVWIMREYGVVESWTKLIIVPQLRVLPSFAIHFPRLMYISKGGGEILLVRDNLFVVYSFKEDKFRTLTCRGYGENHHNVHLPWPRVDFEDVSSLVSPNDVMGFAFPSRSLQDGTV